mmetsp:Transcript_5105/g.14827  ORF Transcript_5105/g.14827 Transcript_5105/m.14827 type:complete len:511 (+) Transcript_5105:313-1845(+)
MPSLLSPNSGEQILLAVNDVCFFLLGGSAWIMVNGIYAQIPSIILFFDGDYGVVSKITLCVTLSALLPIIGSVSCFATSTLTKLCFKGSNCDSSGNNGYGSGNLLDNNNQCSIHTGIALLLWLGFVVGLVLTVWTEQVLSRLVPLLVATIAGGIVGTTSSILYYSHAAITPNGAHNNGSLEANIAKRQTTAMLFGTAASNLFVAILAISEQEKQQQQEQPVDSSAATTNAMRTYFGTIAILMGLAVLGFVGTIVIRRIAYTAPCSENSDKDDGISLPESSSLIKETFSQQDSSCIAPSQSQSFHGPSSDQLSFWETSSLNSVLNTAQCILNILTFFLPGIVPYSVRDTSKDESYNAEALRYLVVSQLVAQTLGVLASSIGCSSDGVPHFLNCHKRSGSDIDNTTVKYQLGCLFFLLWIPLVVLSFQPEMQLGIGLPIFLNAALNFAYGYFNTKWFHLLAERNCDRQDNEDRDAPTSLAVRVMGTWHQIGATIGSAIAFELVQNGVLGQNR